MRSYCIPIYAPHPVAAHAWLNEWLEPSVEAGAVAELQLPVPLEQARPLIDSDAGREPGHLPAAAGAGPEHRAVDLGTTGQQRRDQIWAELTG